MRQIVLRAFMVLSLAAFVACANGNDSSSISSNNPAFTGGTIPLSVAERVTVVDAKDVSMSSSSVRALNADFGALAEYYYIPSGTPFYTDTTRVYVNERSADIFGSINDILCNLNLTGYKEMMNKGYYIALTDDNKCSQNGGSSSGEPNFLQWLLQSIREDNTSPHVIEGWVLPDASGKSELDIRLEFKAQITETKSDSNPFGIFKIDFGMYFKPAGQPWQLAMKLFIRSYRDPATEKVLVEYGSMGMDGSDGGTNVAVMNRGADSLSGDGSVFTTDYVYNSVSGNYEQMPVDYNFAFNDTHFRRQDVVNSVVAGDSCYFRNSFNEDVWSYGLYDVDGARFELNTGFPIKYIYNGEDHYGYIGYWGLSLNDWDAPLISNDILYRDDSSPYAGTAYELLLAGGKLTKHYTVQKALNDFQNMDMDYYYWDYASPAGGWQQIQLQWNGSVLNKVAVYNSNTYTYDPIPPVQFPMTNLNDQVLNVYSKVGSMEVVLSNCTPNYSTGYSLYDCDNPTGITPVKMRQYATVKPTDTAAMADLANGLLCFKYCPDAAQVQSFTSPYYYYDSTYEAGYPLLFQSGVTPTGSLLNTITYSFDPATMLLKDDARGQDVVFGPPPDNNYYYLDYGTGPMISNTPANKALLACSADAASTCADNAYNLPVYYTWQTGDSSGYHLALLKELGTSNFYTFDEPLPLSYTYKGAGEYYGQTFMLTYYGFNNWISGIPTKCVDPDDWSDLVTNDCYGNGGRTVNAFNLPFGGKLTFTEDDGTIHEYFAKALSKEQYMLKLADMTPCDIINVTSYPLPDPDTAWVDPAMGIPAIINAPPAVVDGELQVNGQ